MKKSLATSLGKAAAFSAIALAVSAALAQDAERIRPLSADVKINKQLQITGQPQAGYNPQFNFNVNVTENELPRPPEGCRWEKPTYQPPGGNTAVTTGGAAQVTVINHLVCAPPDKCQQARELSTSLTGVSRWVRTSPSGPLYSWPSNTYAGTPGANWVGVTPSISTTAPAGDFKTEIQFCLCSGGTAKADVNTYRADNSAKLSFDGTGTTVTAPQNSFNSASPAGSGALSLPAASVNQTHSLVNVLHNDGGPTAWNMFGTLAVSKGYWGACEGPQR